MSLSLSLSLFCSPHLPLCLKNINGYKYPQVKINEKSHYHNLINNLTKDEVVYYFGWCSLQTNTSIEL